MLRQALLSLVLGLALSPGVASVSQAAPLWGAWTEVSLGDMFPSGGQNNFTFDEDGPRDPISGMPEGGAVTSHSLIDDSVALDFRGTGPWNRGVAEASATLNFGALPAPSTLRARAVLTGNTSNQSGVTDAAAYSTAVASDSYQYIGAVPTNLSITFTLTGSLANSPPDPTFQTVLAAQIAVFSDSNYRFSTSLDSLRFEDPPAIAKAFDDSTLFTTAHTAGGTISLSQTLTFAVVPGEQFHVWQRLAAWAAGDARSADAFSTLTATFSNPELVQSLAIPEPNVALLLGIGLAIVAARRRGRVTL